MVLDDLGSSIQSSLNNLRNKSRVSEEDIDEIVKDIQRSLLKADVDVGLVDDITTNIRERSLEEEPPAGTPVRDHVLRIVYQELVNLVGDSTEIELEPQVILLAGLQGSGKTTTAAKLAWWFETKGLDAAVIQTDTFRPGAVRQARQLSEEADVDCYGEPDNNNPVEIARNGLEELSDADVHIVDTAGRHALEDELIEEIKAVDASVNPDHRLLVLDAAIGQKAKDQAKEFNNAINIDGVVLTKVDGTAKGGGALTAVNETDSTIAYLGSGETVKDIERFEPDSFISRLLGMGDLEKLAERVENAMEEEIEDDDWDPEEALEDGDFTLYDMKRQMEAMQNMGPMGQVFDMIPGMGGGLMSQLPDDAVEQTEEVMEQFEVMMDSMTEEELKDPDIINDSRKERIARGSGVSEEEVEQLLEQYNMMSNALEQFQNMDRGQMKQMMEEFGGGGGGLGPF